VHFEAVGGSPRGVIETTLTNPGQVASELLTATDVQYMILLALPFLGLFVLAPVLALPALPTLVVNMLSGAPPMTSVREHYVAGVVPFLFAATIVGLRRFGARRRVMLASMLFQVGLVLSLAFGPWPGLAIPDVAPEAVSHQRPVNREAAFTAITLIPANAAVAATGAAGAHLSERRYFYSKLDARADWVLIDRSDRLVSYFSRRPLVEEEPRLRSDDRWRVVFERGDIALYHRVTP
jgi:uncharacterized membrane protein